MTAFEISKQLVNLGRERRFMEINITSAELHAVAQGKVVREQFFFDAK